MIQARHKRLYWMIVVAFVRDATERYDISSVMTFGGEPLLYPETAYAAHAPSYVY